MEYLKDPQDSFSILTVQDQEWLPMSSSNKSPSFGFDHETFWFRFPVNNMSSETDWIVEIGYAPLDDIHVYVQDTTGGWTVKKGGDLYPISEREFYYRNPVFKVSLPTNADTWMYLRVNTISSVQVPVVLWSNDEFHSASFQTQIINGLFFGAMFIMAFYQLFLYFSIRDKSTLYYVFTLFAMINVIGFFQGYNFLYLHPENPGMNDSFAALSGPLFILSSALLTRTFLRLRYLSPWLDRIMMTNALLALLAGILMIVYQRQIPYKYHHLFTLFHCVLVLLSAAYCLMRRFRPALFYLMAWAALLLAASLFTMGNLGFAPGYMGTNFMGLIIGCILQVLLISFALGERWNLLVKENQQVKEMELKRRREENVRLENEVRLRTEELMTQKVKLEELNKIKDKLFSVVSHDIKEPLTSLKLSVALARMDKLSPDEFKAISVELDNHLDRTTDFIQNLLQWAKFQLRGESVRTVSFVLNPLIEETTTLIAHSARQKGISIHTDVPEQEVVVKADIVMIQSVIRNLLTNAVKFSPPGGTVQLQLEPGNEVIISVSDAGVGIPENTRDKIFTLENVATMGTRAESGTGLGLVLCKEFVEKNGGRIWFESTEGKGSRFYFTLVPGDPYDIDHSAYAEKDTRSSGA
jgi:signal transduction histidine kinase